MGGSWFHSSLLPRLTSGGLQTLILWHLPLQLLKPCWNRIALRCSTDYIVSRSFNSFWSLFPSRSSYKYVAMKLDRGWTLSNISVADCFLLCARTAELPLSLLLFTGQFVQNHHWGQVIHAHLRIWPPRFKLSKEYPKKPTNQSNFEIVGHRHSHKNSRMVCLQLVYNWFTYTQYTYHPNRFPRSMVNLSGLECCTSSEPPGLASQVGVVVPGAHGRSFTVSQVSAI